MTIFIAVCRLSPIRMFSRVLGRLHARTMDFAYVDEIIRTYDQECFEMIRRPVREEGILLSIMRSGGSRIKIFASP